MSNSTAPLARKTTPVSGAATYWSEPALRPGWEGQEAAEAAARRFCAPPEGFHLFNVEPSDWHGPEYVGHGWRIPTFWDAERGINFYVDGDSDESIAADQIDAIRNALAEVQRLA